MTIDSVSQRRIRSALLRWYGRAHRDLPWRRTRDPYAILASELMLQQTQVSTVIPYYERFMREFPTPATLAKSSMDRVLKVWEGLGYYSRARHFKHLAETVMTKHAGKIPATVDELAALPGVGRSTAGAVASIAFDQPAPILDGNVKRVLSRLFTVRGHSSDPKVLTRLWELSAAILSPRRPGDFNQAMMELGATLCVPRRPSCLLCPLQKECRAYAKGLQERLPERRRRRAIPHYEVAVGILMREDKIYIQRRPERGLLGGLWELPGGKRMDGESLDACLRREVIEEAGLRAIIVDTLSPVRHAYSHFSVTIYPFLCKASGSVRRGAAPHRWVSIESIDEFAFPAANKKIFASLIHRLRRAETLRPESYAAESLTSYPIRTITS